MRQIDGSLAFPQQKKSFIPRPWWWTLARLLIRPAEWPELCNGCATLPRLAWTATNPLGSPSFFTRKET